MKLRKLKHRHIGGLLYGGRIEIRLDSDLARRIAAMREAGEIRNLSAWFKQALLTYAKEIPT